MTTAHTAAWVAAHAAKVRSETTHRDKWICTMHDEGATYRAIAEAAGLSPAGVQRIVKRRST